MSWRDKYAGFTAKGAQELLTIEWTSYGSKHRLNSKEYIIEDSWAVWGHGEPGIVRNPIAYCVFDSDEAAYLYVLGKAESGNTMHQAAIILTELAVKDRDCD